MNFRSLIICILWGGLVFSELPAQQLKWGAGLSYGSLFNAFGLNARGVYEADDTWRGEVDAIVYLEDYVDLLIWEANANLNYVVVKSDLFALYGLAGGNISSFQTYSIGATKIGLNVGAGFDVKIFDLAVFGEIKYNTGVFSHVALSGGVLFDLF